jgi:hypothetical protein
MGDRRIRPRMYPGCGDIRPSGSIHPAIRAAIVTRRGRPKGGTNKEPPIKPLLPPIPATRPTAWAQTADYRCVQDLWFAVLQIAVSDLASRYDAERSAAKNWVLDTRREPQSCAWVCDVLGISHEAFVKAVLSREGRARILAVYDTRER